MKSQLLLLSLLISANSLLAQNVGIGTNTPNASAQLDVSSTSKGMLAPRMTTTQRNAITSPVKGLMVYDTDLNSLYHYNGSGWAAVGAGGGGFSLPFEGSVNIGNPGFKVTNAGAGPAIQAVTTNEFGIALQASNNTNYGYSVYAYSRSPNGIGVYANVDSSIGVKGESGKGIGVDAISTDSTALRARIIKGANTDPVVLATHSGAGAALHGISQTGVGVRGVTSTANSSAAGVYGENNGTQGSGVQGVANFATGYAVKGESNFGTGVYGYSGNNKGVSGSTISGTALYGNGGSGYGLEVMGKVKISGGNTNPSNGAVLTSDATGNAVWKNSRISFGVQDINTNYVSVPNNVWRRVHFASSGYYDYSNNYNLLIGTNVQPTSSCFTAPVNGSYHFDAAAYLSVFYLGDPTDITNGDLALKLNRNGAISNLVYDSNGRIYKDDGGNASIQFSISRDLFLMAGDIVYVEVRHLNGNGRALFLGDGTNTYFNAHLVAQ